MFCLSGVSKEEALKEKQESQLPDLVRAVLL